VSYQRYEKEDKKHEEKNLCDAGCRKRDTRESEHGAQKRKHKESQGPIQHYRLL
jgi:hypothetical protein